jgi:hypothetical protein
MHSSDVAGREIGIGRDCSRLLVVTKDVHEMMNTEKRNIMFWWYATNNVYKVVGANNAWKLPPCLEKCDSRPLTE